MPIVLSIVLGVLLAVAAVVGGLHWLGKRLAPTHEVSKTLRLRSRPESVWMLLTDVPSQGEWWPGVKKIVAIEQTSGSTATSQQKTGRDGAGQTVRVFFGRERRPGKKRAKSMVMRTTKVTPIRGQGAEQAGVIERQLDDDRGRWRSTWSYLVVREAAGTTRVELTETGTVERPISRAILRHVVGEDAAIRRHLSGLATKLGDEARFDE